MHLRCSIVLLSCADQKLDEYDVAQVYGEDTVGTFDQVCVSFFGSVGMIQQRRLKPEARRIMVIISRLSPSSTCADAMC